MFIKHLFTVAPNERVEGYQYLPSISKVLKLIFSVITTIASSHQPALIVRKKELDRKTLLKCSQLQTPVSKALEKIAPSNRTALLGHIHGGRVIAKTRLERLPTHAGAQVLSAYLQEESFFKEGKAAIEGAKKKMAQFAQTMREIEALSEEMQVAKKQGDATSVWSYAQQLMQRVHALDEGESFLIGGEGVDGSLLTTSVLYEFKKKGGNRYDLFIYVMEKGDASFGAVVDADHKRWIRPYRCYENVPSSLLFFNKLGQEGSQSDRFQAILESRIFAPSPKYAALHLFGDLQAYLIPPKQELNGLVSAAAANPYVAAAAAHRDGWYEEKLILRCLLDLQTYKKVMVEIKFAILSGGVSIRIRPVKRGFCRGG